MKRLKQYNIINWNELNIYIKTLNIENDVIDENVLPNNFIKFISKFFNTIKIYVKDSDKSNFQNSIDDLVTQWPIYLYLQNTQPVCNLNTFWKFSNNFFKIIDDKYFIEFINESFQIKGSLFKDINNLTIFISNLEDEIDKSIADVKGLELTIKIIENNRDLIKNHESMSRIAIYYYTLAAKQQKEKITAHKSYSINKLYKIKNTLDKGLKYFQNFTDQITSDYIKLYLNIDLSFKINFHFKKMVCGSQIQKLMHLLPNNEDKELLKQEIRGNYLGKYNSEKFKKLDLTKISKDFISLYYLTNLIIKYFEADNIEEKIFNHELNFITLPSTASNKTIAKDYVIQQIILLKFNNNNFDNIVFLFNQLSKEYYLLALCYRLKIITEPKEIFINKLSELMQDYGKDQNNIKKICGLTRKLYSLEKIKEFLEEINTVNSNENYNRDLSTLKIVNSEKSSELERSNKVKTKTKGIADPNKTEKKEKTEIKEHKTSWVIDNKIITDSDREVIKIDNKNYYVYIDSNINIAKKQLNQFKKAAANGFIAANSYGKNGLKNINKKTIELKINDNLRCFTKTIYINEHGEKLILFSEQPKNHNQADTYIKNIVNGITKIYVCSADLEENEIESTDTNNNFGDDSGNNSNPNCEYPASGEVEHHTDSI